MVSLERLQAYFLAGLRRYCGSLAQSTVKLCELGYMVQ